MEQLINADLYIYPLYLSFKGLCYIIAARGLKNLHFCRIRCNLSEELAVGAWESQVSSALEEANFCSY